MGPFSKLMSDKRTGTCKDAKGDAGSKQADYCLGVDPNELGTKGSREYGKHISADKTSEDRPKHPSAQQGKKRSPP